MSHRPQFEADGAPRRRSKDWEKLGISAATVTHASPKGGPLTADERSTVAAALGELMLHGSSLDLRLQAALVLGEFTDISGVLSTLGSLALEPQELLDLRYSALTSLERAGSTPECVNLLRQLSNDEMLGCSAQSALARWHLDHRD